MGKINKECTNPKKFSSSVGFKLLHPKAMEASVIRTQGKRMILPKSNTNSNIDSMSLKTATQPEIFKGPIKSSKGKVILRTAGPEATKKLLPIKPKQQIFIIQNEKPQALTADAELIFSIPARNQPAYTISLDENSIETVFTDEIEETWNTNENVTVNNDTVDKEYCIDNDKETNQGVIVQPGRHLLDLNCYPITVDPFLSELNITENPEYFKDTLNQESISLVRDLDSFNTATTQEDSELDQVIGELNVPVANSMDTLSSIWGPEALNNDLIYQVANPLEVEGREFANDTSTEEASNSTSTSSEDCRKNLIPSHEDITSVDAEMKDIFENTDEEWIASLIDEIENNPESATKTNDQTEEPDLLEMVIDDSIGIQTLAQQLNTPLETLNINDLFSKSENEIAVVAQNPTQMETSNLIEIAEEPVQLPRRRGRPRKERTEKIEKRSRGRPAKLHSASHDVMAAHHNYSVGGTSNSHLTTDERRYRRMRDLNNVASQRCRLNRKKKMNGALDELKKEEEKNKLLTMRVRLLEEQVLSLKDEFKKRISNPRMILTSKPKVPSVGTSAITPDFEFDFERFVEETVDTHLTN